MKVGSRRGGTCRVRALLDSCSEVSLVSLQVARRLRVTPEPANRSFIGVGGGVVSHAPSKLPLRLHLPDRPQPLELEAFCLWDIGITTPALPIQPTEAARWRAWTLADPMFGSPQRIELLLGVDVLPELMKPGVSRQADLMAQRTSVGWVISGCAPSSRAPVTNSKSLVLAEDTEPAWSRRLAQSLQRFWETDGGAAPSRTSSEDEFCKRSWAEHRRAPDGRYITRLPLKDGAGALLGESLKGALAALASLRRRMARDEPFASEYTKFMNEYLTCGHMRVIPKELLHSSEGPINYIPHHGIWQRGDQGPKLRVVFNASRPTSTGLSLNDVLYTGRKLQRTLWSVILKWRVPRFVFCADIKMMFRMIWVDERDVDLQRIVWFIPEEDLVVHCQLLTVTYGEGCAPYLALQSLDQLCIDEGAQHEKAVRVLQESTYMDDIFSGADDIATAIHLRDEIIELLKAGGFHLRKWVANSPEVLEGLPSEDQLRPSWIQLGDDGPVRELGIAWDPRTDALRLTSPTLGPFQRTKREVLSAISSLFDPCGWIAPVVLIAKLLLQDMWLADLSWDEALPAAMSRRWESFKADLPLIENIHIPRWLQTRQETVTQLHAFADASRRAMAATVYIRVQASPSDTVVRLIAARTKLSPIRSLKNRTVNPAPATIPRLELKAALLAARLLRSTADELGVPGERCYAWSDAAVALCWIRSTEPVSNALVEGYVTQIQELIPSSRWNYVATASNPADAATRGLGPAQLAHHRLWFDGPAWLAEPPTGWPTTSEESGSGHPDSTSVTAATLRAQHGGTNLLKNFSDLSVLLRFLIRMRRWIRRRLQRLPTLPITAPCTVIEFTESMESCIRLSQSIYFREELAVLGRGSRLPARHPLRGLDVFVDPSGLLRVGGRLQHSSLTYSERHPPLIDGRCSLATLLIRWAHHRALHGGFRLTYIHVIRRAWVTGGKRRIRSYINHCVTCARARARPMEQQMAPLPPGRVNPARAFSRTGIDYAGPFQVLANKGRGSRTSKAYVAVFVCLTTKALHLELAGDLSTETFLATLSRFWGRRGRPSEIWSDNATYFRRADLELRRAFEETSPDWTRVESALAPEGIRWRFIPPSAPHFGGLWESGVRSFKAHLKRIAGSRRLTFEEFSTLLVSIEMVLNSRPLAPLSGDLDDLDPLTPGHFLVGEFLGTIPLQAGVSPDLDRLTHWKMVDAMRACFWDRWSREYLNSLQQRGKWTRPRTDLRIGDLVLILDGTLLRPNGRWPLGRVTHLHPGPDGHVRTATVRTATGEYQRPIVKLSILPIKPPDEGNAVPDK